MAGRLVSIVGKQTFTINYAASGSSPYVVLGPRFFDTRDATNGVLTARVFACSGIPASQSILIGLYNAMVMPDDPGVVYSVNAANPQVCACTINAADTGFPRLYIASFTPASTNPCGPMCVVSLTANGNATGQASITLGVDLLIRDT
jgi:hypothetical protein